MGNKKVLMLAFLFPPTAAAGSFRTLRFVKYLRDFGWDPLVVTTFPEFAGYREDATLSEQVPPEIVVERTVVRSTEEAIFGGIRRFLKQGRADHPAGAPTAQASSPTAMGNGNSLGSTIAQHLRQMRNSAFFTPDRDIAWSGQAIRASKRLVSAHHVSVLYSTSPPHSTHVIALRLKRITGLPWVADFRDPWARSPWWEDRLPASQRRREARLEASCVRMADRVVLNTVAARSDFVRAYPDQPAEKFVAIPNGFDPELLTALQHIPQSVPDKSHAAFTICHPGSLYNQRDPRPFLLGMKRMNHSPSKVVFEQIGHVDPEFGFTDFIQDHALQPQVQLEDMMDHQAVLGRMARADAFLIIQPGTATQIPGKLYEMIPFGKPIIALTGPGETADLVQNHGLGVVARPTDIDAIARALESITDPIGAGHRPCPKAIEAFNGRSLTQKLAEEFCFLSHN